MDPTHIFAMKEPAPPAAGPSKFTVTGKVEIQLYGSVVQSVDGRTGGDTNASVIYDNDGNKNENLSLSNIASLTMRSGDLQPAGISSTAPIALSVSSGAVLGLQNIGSTAVSDFTGGGTLVLGADQTLDIQGKVTGKTKVAIGGYFNDHSQTLPTKDHPYIKAPQSVAGSFVLIPYANDPQMSFTRNDQGQWLIPSGDAPAIKISTISVVSETTVSEKDTPVDIPVEVTYADGAAGHLDDIQMNTVSVTFKNSPTNGTFAGDGAYTFSQGNIQEVSFPSIGGTNEGTQEVISVTGRGANGTIEPGTYTIRFSILPKNMADGKLKSVETRLIVTEDAAPGPDPVPGDLGKAEVTVAGGSVYTGEAVEPQVTVILDGTPLKQGTDYTVKYADNVNAGTAKVIVTAVDSGKYTGSAEKTFTIEKAKLTCKAPVLSPKTYDGTADASVDSVSFYQGADKKDLVKGRDYTAQGTYNSADVKDADTVTVNVALMGDAAANYALENGSLTVGGSIAKAQAQSVPGSLTVTTHQAMDYSYDLSKLLPAPDAGKSYGTVTYALGDIQLGQYYPPGTASIKDGTLILPILEVSKAQEGPIGTVKIQITADNYTVGDAVISVDAVSKQTPQGQPQLSAHTLIYGQPLSTIKLSGTMADASGKPVPGSFTWNDPGKIYAAGTHSAAWTFVPQDTGTYLTVSGDSSIQVEKAAPSGAPQYTPITTSGKTLADAGLTPLRAPSMSPAR